MASASLHALSNTARVAVKRLPVRMRPAREAIDWNHVPLSELIEHLQSVHHHRLREIVPPLAEGMTRMAEQAPAHAEPARLIVALLTTLMLHLDKLEQVVYPLLRRIDRGQPGAEILARLVGPEALDLKADASAIQEGLPILRMLARRCPDPGTTEVVRQLDDRIRRFVRLVTEVLLPRAVSLTAEGRSA